MAPRTPITPSTPHHPYSRRPQIHQTRVAVLSHGVQFGPTFVHPTGFSCYYFSVDFDLPFLLFYPHHPYHNPPGDFGCNTTDSPPEDYDCITNNVNESDLDESTGNNAKGWNIKYYKGLGTLTSSAAKEYFSNLNIHEIHFTKITTNYISSLDDNMSKEGSANMISTGSGLIEMAFSKSKVEDRKRWLNRVK